MRMETSVETAMQKEFDVEPNDRPPAPREVLRGLRRAVTIRPQAVSVSENFPVRKISEVFNVQFRAELFNLPNHPNWAQPNNTVFLNGVGANGTVNPNAGRVTSIIGSSRQIQLALRISF